MDRAEDLLFVISMVERGALQLLGPLPGTRPYRHRQAFWEEIEQLVTPANTLVERRGDAFCEDGLPEVVHPADAIGLSLGGAEAIARTRTESSTALLLCDAAEDFKRILPSLEGEQLTAAFHLLHALEQWRQSQFGGQIAVHDGTQTEEMGQDAAPAAMGGTEAEAAESPTEPCRLPPLPELYHDNMEPPTAKDAENPQTGGTKTTSHGGVWLGLRGTTESQANKLLGSLAHDLDGMVGESPVPADATLADDDTQMLPGGSYPFPKGGANTLSDGEGINCGSDEHEVDA
ncbi:hypothetical protein AK812_SmicGene44558 [Symbiodinium microadriaticum]|uniref:Uncharacterized protein n=1 Tax=Symbiodinium microadriaticum TaxID=2951 RepID=A0A1Q9BY57_SYMMI|nr:hypothetical protein AK812_SmicGene44558 [Symbiodinium microadriaticum]